MNLRSIGMNVKTKVYNAAILLIFKCILREIYGEISGEIFMK